MRWWKRLLPKKERLEINRKERARRERLIERSFERARREAEEHNDYPLFTDTLDEDVWPRSSIRSSYDRLYRLGPYRVPWPKSYGFDQVNEPLMPLEYRIQDLLPVPFAISQNGAQIHWTNLVPKNPVRAFAYDVDALKGIIETLEVALWCGYGNIDGLHTNLRLARRMHEALVERVRKSHATLNKFGNEEARFAPGEGM